MVKGTRAVVVKLDILGLLVVEDALIVPRVESNALADRRVSSTAGCEARRQGAVVLLVHGLNVVSRNLGVAGHIAKRVTSDVS